MATRLRRSIRSQSAGYRRYILLSQGRSGSTLLGEMLARHPQTVDFAEIFNPDHAPTPVAAVRMKLKQTSETWPLGLWLRSASHHEAISPRDVLDRYVWSRGYPSEVQAVGFKLLAYQMRANGPFPSLRRTIEERLPAVQVILLRRENLLRMYLSFHTAMRTRQWHVSREAERRPRPRLSIDAAELEAFFNRTRAADEELRELAQGSRNIHELTYEQLTCDRAASWRNVLQFLQVDDAPLPPVNLLKTETRPLSMAINNYNPLKRQFARTPWAQFFDE